MWKKLTTTPWRTEDARSDLRRRDVSHTAGTSEPPAGDDARRRHDHLSGFAADAEIDALLAEPGLSECAEARRLKSGEALLPHGAADEPTGA